MRSRVSSPEGVAPAPGIFFGWVITWTAFGILAMAYGVQFSFGVFLPEIVEDTGWTRTQLSLVISAYIFVYSALSGFSGELTDRTGPRRVVMIGAAFLGAGYALTGAAQELWQFAFAMSVIAAIGMSATFVPCSATVARWFDRDRGKALGIATSGGSFGGIIVPPFAAILSGAVGWRTTYIVLAGITTTLLFAASLVLVRDPAEKDLEVDGIRAPESTEPAEPVWGLSRAEAMRTPVFWVAGAIFFFTWMAVFMPLVHLIPFAEDIGISKTAASTMISAVGFGGLLGRTSTGVVSDKIGRLPALAGVLTIQISSFFVFSTTDEIQILFPAAIGFGLGYGGTTTMFPAIFSDQFGQAHVGAIVGAVFSVAGSAAAFGPTVAGYLFDVTDSYRLAFAIGGGMNLVSLGLVGVLAFFLATRNQTAPT